MSARADDVRARTPHGDGADLFALAQQALLDAYRPGDDWVDMFDRLAAADIESLTALFPYMPPRAARHFAERFIIPRPRR